ncbi:MAG: hypothetical protein HQL82_11725 [Magnetococcales bacterium]|nr:hypothetical protein [Magnetococcales bacterium]
MKIRLQNVLKGVGSVFCPWPATEYTHLIPLSPYDQIVKAWSTTGQALDNAMNRFEDAQKTPAKKDA